MDDPVLRHFQSPQNVGEMPDAHGRGQAGDPGCGAVIRIYFRFQGENIEQARFLASGSSAAIAAGSVLTELVAGKSWRRAATVSQEVLEEHLGLTAGRELSPRRRAAISAAAAFAIEALHGALEDSLRRDTFPRAGITQSSSVLVAMSGGVDSSVACLKEKESGSDAIGITMRLWSDPDCGQAAGPTCCSPEAVRNARRACHSLGVPHLTVDLADEFEATVVDYFVEEYMAGLTPNPCTRCNAWFRFPVLMELSKRLGAAWVATGHYARVEMCGGSPLLARGADKKKDQSYMLWGIGAEMLSSLHFPLAGITKDETRRLASAALLPSHQSPESQEVCFIPDNDYRRFLRTRVDKLPQAGDIVDPAGNRLGAHTGYIDYTTGQRRGLGIAASEPLYVLETRPGKNQVVAVSRGLLAVRRLEIGSINIFCPGAIDGNASLQVQVRYNSGPVAALVKNSGNGRLTIELKEPAYGVAPGQSAVLYNGDVVVGGGVIISTGS